MAVAFDHLTPEQVELVASNASDIMSNLDFIASAGSIASTSLNSKNTSKDNAKSSYASSTRSNRVSSSTSSRRESGGSSLSRNSVREGSRSRVSSGADVTSNSRNTGSSRVVAKNDVNGAGRVARR